ncbi:MAG: ADP-ribosylglycohydrolase family protein [Gammaproteobacteria bacterium]|nr:ADP-ribosylglycohydrolase family protein [Gammaproteobacteria bacterium]MBU2451618.1 ADP-ribosylglycohydrolase family protein [Gammaproteobacteria bacterium]
MLGCIIGDLAGSRFEGCSQNPKDVPLFVRHQTTFTDDSICTIAVAEALLNNQPVEETLRSWCKRYPDRGYGSRFRQWIYMPETADRHSYGNGAAMRIAPVGLLAADSQAVTRLTAMVTDVSHDHPEARRGAGAVAASIRLALSGLEKRAIGAEIHERYGYQLSASIQDLHDQDSYSESCQDTVPVALICALKASCFEEAIRNAIYIGGDTDTIACIAGGLAEALYGIPAHLVEESQPYLPGAFLDVLQRLYAAASQPMPLAGSIKALPKPTSQRGSPSIMGWFNSFFV